MRSQDPSEGYHREESVLNAGAQSFRFQSRAETLGLEGAPGSAGTPAKPTVPGKPLVSALPETAYSEPLEVSV